MNLTIVPNRLAEIESLTVVEILGPVADLIDQERRVKATLLELVASDSQDQERIEALWSEMATANLRLLLYRQLAFQRGTVEEGA